MEKITLNGAWLLTRMASGASYPATVPGVVHTDLLTAGVIEDPYWRDNERKYLWIGEEDWVYTKEFTVDEAFLAYRARRLVFEGLDTCATVSLNGRLLGRTANMFRRYEFDVAELLRPGKNELAVAFASPLRRANEIARSYPFRIPYVEGGFFAGRTDRNMLRKCQCHAGWDWGPTFLTVGIWRDVELLAYDDLRIDYLKPLQFHQDGRVEVRIIIYVDVARAGTYEFTLSLGGEVASRRVELPEGKGQVDLAVEIASPALWWPLDYGPQTLHELVVTVADAEGLQVAVERRRVGLRAVELVQEPDEHGRSFFFRINGVPIFLKGYNWIPADCFSPRMTRKVYEDLIESVAAAHCNVLRVWGGGIYEQEDFYDLCDEKGILVWQDFMFACAMYPWDDEFLANVAEEVVHQLRRLACHPCIFLLCGNNENEAALDWYPETKAARDRFVVGYHRLYLETIGRLAARERPDLPYWPSSPSNGPEEYGDPNNPTRGDVHYWRVWHGGQPFEDYLTVKPRLVSEFGFQSIPSVETLLTVMKPEDLNPSSPMMDYRQRSRNGNQIIVAQMMHEYRLPSDFAGFVYLSQVQQAAGMKLACEHWRRSRFVTMGTIIWQLNDIWPGLSWSAIEYGGKWKVLHAMARRFFAPLLLSLAKSEAGVAVWGTNDRLEAAVGSFSLEVWRFEGRLLRSWRGPYELGPGESRCLMELSREELLAGEDPTRVFLVLRGGEGDSSPNWEFLAPARACPLPRAEIALTASPVEEGTEIRLLADRPAFYVWLEIPGRRGIFSDNAFLLLPGEEKRVVFTPRDGNGPVRKEEIRVIHLGETY
ncbi:MAG: beta-mannosidase [Bacillota bacterium]